MRLFSRKYRYSRVGNVRIDKASLIVERLYVTKIDRNEKTGRGRILKKEWKVVDYKTTYLLAEPRRCPPDLVDHLLRTAF